MGMSTPILIDMHHLYGSNSNNFYLTFFCLLKYFGRQGHHVFHSQVDPHNCFGFSAIMLLLIRFITSSGVSDNVWSSILSVVFSKNELSVLDNKFSVKTLSSVSFPIFNSYYFLNSRSSTWGIHQVIISSAHRTFLVENN
jgi:hypothetical protein